MSASDPSDPDVVDPLSDDPLAFLYEPGEEDEDEDSTADNPSYGSLMGLAVRRDGAIAKPAKAMAIVLDEMEATRAAEVMEINAGQLMTNPDRSNRHVGFLNLDPVEAMQIEEEEDDLAESLSWEDEEDEDPDWQPENPLAGTGVAEEDDDDDWQPVNPLAGTGLENQDDDDVDWQPVNPLAGTGIEQHDDWDEPAPEAEEAPAPVASLSEPVEEPAPAAALYEPAEEGDWAEPVAEAALPETALPEAPPPETAPPEDDLWESVLPPADAPAPAEEQAWSGSTAAEPVQEFEEVEWEAPLAPAAEAEEEPAEAEAAFDAPAEPVALEEPEAAEVIPPESDEPPPIEWQLLLAKKTPKKPLDLSPIDWGEFAAEEDELEGAEADVSEEAFAELAAPVTEDVPELASEDAAELAEAVAGYAEDEPELAEAELPVELAETADDEWQPAVEEAIEDMAEPATPHWEQFAEEEADELVAAAEPEWQGYSEEVEAFEEASALPEPEPEPEQIEIVRFPAPPPVEIPHHSLRAKLLKAQQPRTPPPSRLKPVLKWLHAQFVRVVLPQLKKLFAWAKAKWEEIAARPPPD